MFGGVYGDARMLNWPHWHHTPLPGIATMGPRRDKGVTKNEYNLFYQKSDAENFFIRQFKKKN